MDYETSLCRLCNAALAWGKRHDKAREALVWTWCCFTAQRFLSHWHVARKMEPEVSWEELARHLVNDVFNDLGLV